MKIGLVIFSLSSGGAERVMSILANNWAESGEDVTLITVDSINSDFYSLNPNIRRESLELKKQSHNVFLAIKNNIIKLIRLRAIIKKHHPEIVISFMDRMNVSVLIATRGLSIPIIVSEHTDPRQMPLKGVLGKVRLTTYKWADAVVVLTEELKRVIGTFVSANRIHVIPNPALRTQENSNWTLSFNMPTPSVVAMGRLIPLKGFDLLIEAFSNCKYENWSLIILGEGEQRPQLLSRIKQLNLENRVLLPGRVNNPSEVLQRADLFVLSSRNEGFPMVILEAMSNGLPVISFDCPTGPSEIIRDGIDGILVPVGDVIALTAAMNRLMGDKEERERLSQRVHEVVERFSVEMVMERWNKLTADTKYQSV